MKTLIILLAIFFSSDAEALTGYMFHKTCESETVKDKYICFWYTKGVIDGHKVFSDNHIVKYYCPPEGGNYGQYELIVKKYMNDNPGSLNMNPNEIIVFAMLHNFPCVIFTEEDD